MDHTAGEESGTFSSTSTSHELVETKPELQNASWTWSGSRTPKACKRSSVSAGCVIKQNNLHEVMTCQRYQPFLLRRYRII